MSKSSHRKHEHKSHQNHTTQLKNEQIDTTFHEPSVAKDIGIILCLLALAFFFVVPYAATMSSSSVIALVTLFGLIIVTFMAMVWRTKPSSQSHHKHIEAGHVAYLVAIGLLSIAIITQVIAHQLDVWLVIILASLVVIHSLYRRLP